jgi:molybdopterin converting factor small subunit
MFGRTKLWIHLLIRGRIGDDWYEVDRKLKINPSTTLGEFIDYCDRKGIPLSKAIADSPHLAHTLMINGERTPVEENQQRLMQDGDEIYLLAPIAGG